MVAIDLEQNRLRSPDDPAEVFEEPGRQIRRDEANCVGSVGGSGADFP